MRGEYLVNLIKYHYGNDNQKFEETVKNIIENEKKKRNTTLAEKILDVYQDSKGKREAKEWTGEYSYEPSSGLVMKDIKKTNSILTSPKDKTSSNNLFDLYYPSDYKIEQLVLSEEVKQKVNEVTFEHKNRHKLKKLHLTTENRLLLCGPPGCGKTSTAHFLSYVLDMPLAYVRLDSVITSLLGQTGINIRKIFEAVNDQEIVLFLDEFDAIAKKRDDNHELGELKRVVNTLLQNIDLLPENVFLVAATNHQNLLDKAVWRRFNTVLYLDYPDEKLRKKYIKNILVKFEGNLEIDVNLEKVSRVCIGLSFANIQEILNKAIKKCILHENKQTLNTNDILEALSNSIFLYNKKDRENLSKLKELKESGLSIRELSDLTSIPRSTLSDWMNK
ncbi:ATP-binding protein [Bacillus cereus]|uniref:ATP-binding protein n=1 Tax=Bacillus cereus TaxID=1396 RepID=A0AB73UM26_BACCE|nr:ATP-binding protein [Bacillus cereus]QHV05553.1 ATP-binding protein [Bacillus cereus]QHV45480.1 ATP-binding protein [Bacillus cereus]